MRNTCHETLDTSVVPQNALTLREMREQRPTLGAANLSPVSLAHWEHRPISGMPAEFLTKACSLPVTATAL